MESRKSNDESIGVYEKCRLVFFEVMYSIAEVDSSYTSSYLSMIVSAVIEYAQLLYFVFLPVFPWSRLYVDWWFQILKIFHVEYLLFNTEIIRILAAFGIVLLLCLNFSFVLYVYINERVKHIWSIKILCWSLSLSTKLLFIPILICIFVYYFSKAVALFDVFSCKETSFNCYRTSGIFVQIIGGFFIFIFLLISLIFTFCCFDSSPFSSSVNTKARLRLDAFVVILKFLITAVFSLISSPWVLWCSIFIFHGFLFFRYVWMPPFYLFGTGQFHAVCCSFNLWSTVCLFVCLIQADGASAAVLFYVSVPWVMVLTTFLCTFRKEFVLSIPCSAIKTLGDLELKLRLLLEPRLAKAREQLIDGNLSFEFFTENADICDDCNEMFSCFSHIDTSCFYFILLAHFRYHFEKNKLLAMTSLYMATLQNPLLDHQFLIFRYRRRIHEETSHSQADVLEYIAWQKLYSDACESEKVATDAIQRFWDLLESKTSNFLQLRDIGSLIGDSLHTAHRDYNKLINHSPHSIQSYRCYASFLRYVVHDHKHADFVLSKIASINSGLVDNDTIHLMDENNAIVSASSRLSDLGSIISANKTTFSMFGYQALELIGHNVSKLCPEPYFSAHDGYLKNYITSGHSNVLSMRRLVLVKHKNDGLIPVNLLVKEVSEENKDFISFVAVFKPIFSSTSYAIVNSNSMRITGITSSLVKYFGPINSSTSIFSWFSFYDRDFKKLCETGISYVHTVDKKNFNLFLKVLVEDKYPHIHIICIQESNFDKNEFVRPSHIGFKGFKEKIDRHFDFDAKECHDYNYSVSKNIDSTDWERRSSHSDLSSSQRDGDAIHFSLKRMVTESKHIKETSLKSSLNISVSILFMFLMLFSLAVTITEYELNLLSTNLESVHSGGLRINAIVDVVFYCKTLNLINQGSISDTWESSSRNNLTNLVTFLLATQKSIFLQNSDFEKIFYTNPVVITKNLINGEVVDKKMSLLDALSVFIGSATVIINSPLSDCTLYNPQFFYICTNGLHSILSFLNSSLYEDNNYSEELISDTIPRVQIVCTISACVFWILFIWRKIYPSIGIYLLINFSIYPASKQNECSKIIRFYSSLPGFIVKDLRFVGEKREIDNFEEEKYSEDFINSKENLSTLSPLKSPQFLNSAFALHSAPDTVELPVYPTLLSPKKGILQNSRRNSATNLDYLQRKELDQNVNEEIIDGIESQAQSEIEVLAKPLSPIVTKFNFNNIYKGVTDKNTKLAESPIKLEPLDHNEDVISFLVEEPLKKQVTIFEPEHYNDDDENGSSSTSMSGFQNLSSWINYLYKRCIPTKIDLVIIDINVHVKMFTLTLTIIFFFLLSYFYQILVYNLISDYLSAIIWFSHRRTYMSLAFLNLREFACSNGTLIGSENVIAYFNQFSWIDSSIITGSSFVGLSSTKGLSLEIDDLEIVNACGYWSSSGCSTFYFSLLLQGLHSAIFEYSNVGIQLARKLNQTFTNLAPFDVTSILKLSSFEFIRVSEQVYIREAVDVSRLFLLKKLQDWVINLNTFLIVMLCCFIGSIIFLYLFILHPLITNLHNNAFQMRSLLLLIPATVIENRRVKKPLKSLLKNLSKI